MSDYLATPQTVAHQASAWIPQARTLEWVATSSSRGFSWPRDWHRISCTVRQVLYHWTTREAPNTSIYFYFIYPYETANLLHLSLIYSHKQREWNKRIIKFLIQGGNKNMIPHFPVKGLRTRFLKGKLRWAANARQFSISLSQKGINQAVASRH